MAEGSDDKKVHFTRSRKRSMDSTEARSSIEHSECGCENEILDLTVEVTDDSSPLDLSCERPVLECAICLQSCIHPARLPCGHIFCFLCVKGAAHGNRKCAMCRTLIPNNYFHNPDLLETPEELTCVGPDGFEWFYEGRNGWWQYDSRASREIEAAWDSGLAECELLIAGYLYIIDFRDMCQIRKGQSSKIRRIKRDFASVEKLGVAGLRAPGSTRTRRSSESDKGRQQEEEYLSAESLSYSRSSLDSSRVFPQAIDFLQDQMAELSLNSDDDDSYQ